MIVGRWGRACLTTMSRTQRTLAWPTAAGSSWTKRWTRWRGRWPSAGRSYRTQIDYWRNVTTTCGKPGNRCVSYILKVLLNDSLSLCSVLQRGYSNVPVVPSVSSFLCLSHKKLANMIETVQLLAPSSKLGRHINHYERMSPIKFGIQKSRPKWTKWK